MRAFDFPGSEEALMKRTTTTTPTQALYLMNSPFLHGEARAIANKAPSIEGIYQTVLQRPPTSPETRAVQDWLQRARDTRSAGSWEYGYLAKGSLDFKALPHFENGQWRGKKPLPDSTHGWLHWNAIGGHPEGNRHAALKWTAIESGTIQISGNVKVPGDKGNGIIARIIQPDGRTLGEWTLEPTQGVPTKIDDLKIEVGDEIWFVADSRDDVAFDGFHWAPRISDAKGTISDATADFMGPGLPPLAQLAQALLLSNEFFYID